MSNPWEQRRLGDMSEIKAGGTPSTQNLSYWEPKQIPWLSSGEVHKKRIHFTDNMISQKGLVNSSAQWIPEQSVLIALAGQGKTRGTVAVNEVPLTTNQSIAAIILSDELETNFVFSNLEGRYQELRSMSSGDGSRGGLNKQLVSSITIPYTNIKEQKQIGTFFQKLDETITLYQRKLDLLKRKKQAYLQKMFPRDGEDIPEFRFDGFTDPWEQRKLGEIVQITMGQSPDGSTYLDQPGDHILIQGNADMKDGYVVPRIWTSQVTKTAEAGDLIMSVRAPAGAMGKTLYNAVIGRGVAAIKGNEFIYQMLVKLDSDGYWKKIASGSTFESINSSDLKNALVTFPMEKEQDEIGSFFQKLDETITLHQRKLDLLKKKKQAYLQNMFPGEGEDEPRWRFKEFVEQE